MSSTNTSTHSTRALVLASIGVVYLYFVASVKCIGSGLPALTILGLHWAMESQYMAKAPRLLVAAMALTNVSYWIASTSYILFPLFFLTTWSAVISIAFLRYQTLRDLLAPIRATVIKRKVAIEEAVGNFTWPPLDFDGLGILTFGGMTLDLSNMSFSIGGIDLTYDVDELTNIVAKVDTITVRFARDIKIGELYLNARGDGLPASEHMSFSPISRTTTSSSVSSVAAARLSGEASRPGSSKSEQTPPRKLPSLEGSLSVPRSSVDSPRNNNNYSATPPPPLPPRLPPRDSPVPRAGPTEADRGSHANETEAEKEEMRLAVEASLAESTRSSSSINEVQPETSTPPSSVGMDNETTPQSSRSDRTQLDPSDSPSIYSPTAKRSQNMNGHASMKDPDTSFFYPESDETDNAFMQATFAEGAINELAEAQSAERQELDTKAAIAASLEPNVGLETKSNDKQSIKLSNILARIPWWLKISLGPLATRLILSVFAWSHPITVSSIAATGTGKRVTNLMETSGLKKAHPNQAIFKLIRKVFLWLESGDISIILSDISIHPHIPIASDNNIMVDVKAFEPTAYRNVDGSQEILAKIDGLRGSFKIATYFLPNHESQIPTSGSTSIAYSILVSLPGSFNRELLTIGAAFVKATTMMDLRNTAHSRPPVTLPLPSLTGRHGGLAEKFSFKSFGVAVKQAAGDLAKQKGVQWGVRDAELAKWTAKFAGLMKVMKVDIGGAGEIPIDLYRLRERNNIRLRKKQKEQGDR